MYMAELPLLCLPYMFISIFDPTDTSNSWDNGQDFYVVRYAEVLIIFSGGDGTERRLCFIVM